MNRFILQEKVDTYDYVDIYEVNDKSIVLELLDIYRKKYQYRLFRVIKVLK